MYDKQSRDLDRSMFFWDTICTVIAFLAAFQVRSLLLPGPQADLYMHLYLLPVFLSCVTGFTSYFGGYASPHVATLKSYAWAVTRSLLLTVGAVLSVTFFLHIQDLSRLLLGLFTLMEFGVLLGVRFFVIRYYRKAMLSGRNRSKVLIVGSRERAKDLTRALRSQTEWGVEVIGYLDLDPASIGQMVDGVPIICSVEGVTQCLKDNVVDEVIIAITRSLLKDAEPIAIACEEEGIPLRFMADVFNVEVARMSLSQAGNIPLLTMEPVAQDDGQLFLKRLFDLAITTICLPLLLPLFAAVALAIRLESPGPVFFVQQRVGLRKHLFPMFKFRSMHQDAEERMKEIEHLNEAEGPIFKMTNDPRVTRVGRFIRKTSIDELPQLINVLRGEMSLVGPRPMSIRDVDLFDKGVQRKRFSVKPGITCIWQISGRSDLPFTKWLELDLEYIENWSFLLDLKILIKTVPAVVRSKGAV
ncbi:sugar transferase [Desulfogranum mediterraneum]|uniref:sugar transferase n=1 Tax=Desulfogranum mediterraneum TaxID=160661 RepID=UPI000406D66D|nr:sugar transferase [Desulfogranum mediterraneum]